MAHLVCQHCGTPLTVSEPIGREMTCDNCGRDLRACMQCRHYDTSYNNSCTEPMADPVVEKDRRNFCEYFYFSRASFAGGAKGPDRAADARAKLEGLFGGSGAKPKTSSDEARAKLESLFKKPKSDE